MNKLLFIPKGIKRMFSILLAILLLFITFSSSSACGTTALASVLTADFASFSLSPERNASLPTGCVDAVTSISGGLHIQGWAFDNDSVNTSLQIHVYVGGPAGSPAAHGYALSANTSRPDVHSVFGAGDSHGFNQTISTALTGQQPVYIYAINVDNTGTVSGTNILIGAAEICIPTSRNYYTPIGCVDQVSTKDGAVRITGWSIDPDQMNGTVQIHAYIGGPAGSPEAEGHAVLANTSRPDVDAVYHAGNTHGFDCSLTTGKTGTQSVYLYAINVDREGIPGGENILLGTRTVTLSRTTIDAAPVGYVDSMFAAEGTISVRGWAFDSDSDASCLPIHIAIGAPFESSSAELHTITANAPRADIGTVFGVGSSHGFEADIKTSLAGTQTIYLYAANVDANGSPDGAYQLLDRKALHIPAPAPLSASAAALLDIAAGELNYQGTAANGTGAGDYTKYGEWFGYNGVKWCAEFVSWCADRAGISTDIIPKTASTASMIQTSSSYTDWSSTGIASLQRGDIIFFSTSASKDSVCHTGILSNIDREGNHIITIEGNTASDTVCTKTYTIDPATGKIISGWDNYYVCGFIPLPR